MRIQTDTSQAGVSVLEVLIAIGITALLIVGIGASFGSIHHLSRVSADQQTALTYTKEPLELLTAAADDVFNCVCADDTCADTDSDGILDRCDRTSGDGQQCDLRAGYTSCWTTYGDALVSNTPLHVENAGGIISLSDGPDSPAAQYQRTVSIVNIDGDNNRKKITSEVTWTDNGTAKSVSLSTILTGWENL